MWCAPAPICGRNDVPVDFDGRRRAGVQIAVEFRDPDNHRLEIYWGIDQIAPGAAGAAGERMEGRPQPGGGYRRSRLSARTPR